MRVIPSGARNLTIEATVTLSSLVMLEFVGDPSPAARDQDDRASSPDSPGSVCS
jgi:hypothetical protein